MGLVTPHAWTAGDDATSTALQTLTDGVTQLQGGVPTGSGTATDFFRAVQVTAQTGLTASTFVSISFDTTSEAVDSAGGHSTVTSNTRYVGKTAGWYEVSGVVAFAANPTGLRNALIALNGTGVDGSQVSQTAMSSGITAIAISPQYVQMNGTTDYVEIQGWSNQASWGTNVSAPGRSCLHVKWIHS